MRFYSKKFGRRLVDRRVNMKVPDRDALLYSIDQTSHTCQIKIQGSTSQITAHYPRNWWKLPYYMKIGNAVRVRHKEGNRGYVEVIGEGRSLPSGVGYPILNPDPDGIISGLEVHATIPISLCVTVTSGIYRIGGSLYYFMYGIEGLLMGDSSMVMGSNDVLLGGTSAAIICLSAPPAEGYCRYDLLQIGKDEVIDVKKGVEVETSTTPTMPEVDVDHIKIDHIFRPCNEHADGIEEWQIGYNYYIPAPTYVTLTWNESSMNEDPPLLPPYTPGDPQMQYFVANIHVYDQYETEMSQLDFYVNGDRWEASIEIGWGSCYLDPESGGFSVFGTSFRYYHDYSNNFGVVIKVGLPDYNVYGGFYYMGQ